MTLDEYLVDERVWLNTHTTHYITVMIKGRQIEVLRTYRETEKAWEVTVETVGSNVAQRKPFWVPKAALIRDKESEEYGLIESEDRWGGLLHLARWYADSLEAKQNFHIIS